MYLTENHEKVVRDGAPSECKQRRKEVQGRAPGEVRMRPIRVRIHHIRRRGASHGAQRRSSCCDPQLLVQHVALLSLIEHVRQGCIPGARPICERPGGKDKNGSMSGGTPDVNEGTGSSKGLQRTSEVREWPVQYNGSPFRRPLSKTGVD